MSLAVPVSESAAPMRATGLIGLAVGLRPGAQALASTIRATNAPTAKGAQQRERSIPTRNV